jgi:hypothetical protein
MEETVNRWLASRGHEIQTFLESIPLHKEANSITRAVNIPVLNILMLPTVRSDRAFTVPLLVGEDGEFESMAPSKAQEFIHALVSKLNELHDSVFTIGRNEESSIYLKFTEKEQVVE